MYDSTALERIRIINYKLPYEYRYAIDRCPLYDSTIEDVYPTVEDDWHIFPLIGMHRNENIVNIARYTNKQVFQPIVDCIRLEQGLCATTRICDVRVRICINMINSLNIEKSYKDKWIEHIQNIYRYRLRAWDNFYINHYLPF